MKQERIMRYFVEAAHNVIREEGVQGVTIRKVADLAGYTSATLYNYFDDIFHLIFLASITHLEPYHRRLPKHIKWCTNSIERFMATAECFCEFAFADAEAYELLFFKHDSDKLALYSGQYYELYPELATMDSATPLARVFKSSDMHQRSRIQLEDCVAEGFFCAKDVEDFNDMTLMVFKCMLEKVRTGALSPEESTDKMIRYYCQLFHAFVRKEAYSPFIDSLHNLRRHCAPAIVEAYLLDAPGKCPDGPVADGK